MYLFLLAAFSFISAVTTSYLIFFVQDIQNYLVTFQTKIKFHSPWLSIYHSHWNFYCVQNFICQKIILYKLRIEVHFIFMNLIVFIYNFKSYFSIKIFEFKVKIKFELHMFNGRNLYQNINQYILYLKRSITR